jgi:uncharacterized membrane protein YeaQ/YmgE (transglycosylase-associated protein family)
VGIVSWIVVGAVVGCLVSRVAPAHLPGGFWAYFLGGMGGGFVGGGSTVLLTGRNAATIDPFALVVALGGAALLVLIVRKAARAEPRTRPQ